MCKTQDINIYSFSRADRLFFDANIWLYIYGPQGNPGDQKSVVYSNALRNAMRAKSQLMVDILVLSEFINRFTRLEYQTYLHASRLQLDFKQFRNRPEFQPVAQTIVSAVRKILKLAVRTESGFSRVDIQLLLSEFEAGGQDFNDQILGSLCQAQNLKLVTHDADFKNKNINILTANKRILGS